MHIELGSLKLSSQTKNLPSKRERNKTATCNGPFLLARAAGFLNLRSRLLHGAARKCGHFLSIHMLFPDPWATILNTFL